MVNPEVSLVRKGFKLVKEVKIPRLIPVNIEQLSASTFLSSRKGNRCQKRLVVGRLGKGFCHVMAGNDLPIPNFCFAAQPSLLPPWPIPLRMLRSH